MVLPECMHPDTVGLWVALPVLLSQLAGVCGVHLSRRLEGRNMHLFSATIYFSKKTYIYLNILLTTTFCLYRVPYVVGLLRRGLSIPDERVRIGSGHEGWTLGAALAEGGRVGMGKAVVAVVRLCLVWHIHMLMAGKLLLLGSLKTQKP